MKNLKLQFRQLILNFKEQRNEVVHGQKPEAVHELRINVRRLLSLIWIFRQGSDFKVPAGLNRHLRELNRALGIRRELDVACRDSKKFNAAGKKIDKERARAASHLSRFLARKSQMGITRDLSKMSRKLEPYSLEGKRIKNSATKEKLRKKITYWRSHPPVTPNEWHECRIELKKVRYILEALGYAVGPLIEAQDMLGRAHDLDFLARYTEQSKKMARARKAQALKIKKVFRPAIRCALDATI